MFWIKFSNFSFILDFFFISFEIFFIVKCLFLYVLFLSNLKLWYIIFTNIYITCRQSNNQYFFSKAQSTSALMQQRNHVPKSFGHLKKKWCSFCKSNKEAEHVYTSHQLRDAKGFVTCPILYKLVFCYK